MQSQLFYSVNLPINEHPEAHSTDCPVERVFRRQEVAVRFPFPCHVKKDKSVDPASLSLKTRRRTKGSESRRLTYRWTPRILAAKVFKHLASLGEVLRGAEAGAIAYTVFFHCGAGRTALLFRALAGRREAGLCVVLGLCEFQNEAKTAHS